MSRENSSVTSPMRFWSASPISPWFFFSSATKRLRAPASLSSENSPRTRSRWSANAFSVAVVRALMTPSAASGFNVCINGLSLPMCVVRVLTSCESSPSI